MKPGIKSRYSGVGGSGPLSLEESQRLYLNPDGTPWFVKKTSALPRNAGK